MEIKNIYIYGIYGVLILMLLSTSVSAYCSASSGTCNEEHIIKVELNTGSQSSTYDSPCGHDYSGSVLTTLSKGQTYTLKVTGETIGGWTEYVKAWIDFNNNGVFTDSGEEINLGSYTFPGIGGTYIYSATFTVPSSATSGNLKMRVILKYNAAPTSCESFSYGEVEDYTVAISGSSSGSESAQVNSGNMPWSGYFWPMLDKNSPGCTSTQHNLYETGGPMQDYDTYSTNLGGIIYTSSWSVDSPHPYSNNYVNTWTKTVSGATKMRMHFTRYDIEGYYDHLKILDSSNNVITDYSGGYGKHNVYDVWSPWVNGNTIKVGLTTDSSVTYWGFNVDKIQYVSSGTSVAKTWEYTTHRTTTCANGWWGHCDAWSAASIMEAEPTTSRTLNGVTFDRNDQKGLLTETYMGYTNQFWEVDKYSAKSFRDKLREYIKTKGQPIIADIYQDSTQVWNHPMYKYEMSWTTSGDRTDYVTKIWYKTDWWTFDGSASPDAYITYKYYIKTDGTSEFTTNNDPYSYPDFLWSPTSRTGSRANPNVGYDDSQE